MVYIYNEQRDVTLSLLPCMTRACQFQAFGVFLASVFASFLSCNEQASAEKCEASWRQGFPWWKQRLWPRCGQLGFDREWHFISYCSARSTTTFADWNFEWHWTWPTSTFNIYSAWLWATWPLLWLCFLSTSSSDDFYQPESSSDDESGNEETYQPPPLCLCHVCVAECKWRLYFLFCIFF